jgi:acetylornithine deacetylase/succinyl-diaminopimelate desuccinylase-like protein
VHQSGRPQLFFGVRGYAGLEITVYGAERYLHSGHYGNFAPNPALELARLLASMKDADGRVTIAGFYDSAAPLGAAERRALAAVPPFEDELRRDLGLAASEGGDARYGERMALPSLNVRGFVSGSVGETARNVIPPEATASLDLRLVKGDDPEAMLELVAAHVRRQGWHVVSEPPDHATRLAHPRIARLVRQPHYRAVRTAIDLPIVAPVAAAAEAAAGEPVVLTPTLGGSLPLYLFEDRSGLPLIGVPIVNHDNNQHAPNENLRLGNLWYGIDLLAALLTMPAE